MDKEGVPVTELNDIIRSEIADRHYGGLLLYGENFDSAEQVVRLIADIQQTNAAAGGLPMFIAADQEGGNVSRVTFGTTGVSNMALAAAGKTEYAETMGRIFGEELGLLGINVDFAPVMDINNNPNNPVIGIRSFSDSVSIVSEFGLAFQKGLHDTGTLTSLKHFPGHGNTDSDSYSGFPKIDSTLEELKAFELIPFQAAIDDGADMIMTAHIQYPEIEKETYVSISTGEEVYLPATMSDDILTGLLRNDMKFEGVVVSDALDMEAISKNFEYKDVLRYTINAGADMVIIPPVKDPDSYMLVYQTPDLIEELIKNGEISTERLDEAVRRILTLKEKYGLLKQNDFAASEEKIRKAEEGIGSQEHRKTVWNIAEQALTVLKNDDAFPLSVREGEKTLIVLADTCASRAAIGEAAKQILETNSLLPEGAEVTSILHTVKDQENGEEVIKAAQEADHVILLYRSWDSTCLDPESGNGLSVPVFTQIIKNRHEAGKKTIFLSGLLPYDAARFPDADAIVLTYCSSSMKEIPPEKGKGSSYCPNLVAGICSCFGMGTPAGRLPVNIYALDETGHISDTVLWPRAE